MFIWHCEKLSVGSGRGQGVISSLPIFNSRNQTEWMKSWIGQVGPAKLAQDKKDAYRNLERWVICEAYRK